MRRCASVQRGCGLARALAPPRLGTARRERRQDEDLQGAMGYGVSGDRGPVVWEQTFRAQGLRGALHSPSNSATSMPACFNMLRNVPGATSRWRHYRCAGYTAFCPGKLDVASLLSNLRETRRAQRLNYSDRRGTHHRSQRHCGAPPASFIKGSLKLARSPLPGSTAEQGVADYAHKRYDGR